MKYFIYSVIILCTAQVLFAQVDFSGYGAAGFKWYDRVFLRGYNNKVYYEGKLQADITVTNHVDAQLDLRGHSDDNTLEFREFSAKFDYFKGIKVKVGHLRKPFGLEQFVDKDESDAVDDSYIHRELDELGYAGRAVMIMVYHKYKKTDENASPYSYYFSLCRDNSLKTGAIARVEYNGDFWIAGGGFFVQYDGACPEDLSTIAASGDVSIDFGSYQSSLELIYAQDPIEELQRNAIGISGNVSAIGIKTDHKFVFDTQGEIITSVEPFIIAGCYIPDIASTKGHTLQTVLGVNIYFEPEVRVRINGDLLLHKTKYQTKYNTYDSRVTAELQVRF